MIRVVLALTATLAVSACGSDSSLSQAPAPVPTPPPTSAVSFTDFVKDEIGNTSDKREPVAINGLDFEFADDPKAFDALFPAAD